MTAGPLAGLRVWVTRPAHQAEELCAAIEAAGGHALRQPLLAIEGPRAAQAAVEGLAAAESDAAAIFTSTNAVAWAWRLAPGWRPPPILYGVGAATRDALAERSGRAVIAPGQDYSSEGLLAQPELQTPRGQRIALVSGEDGRGKLTAELTARGAQVREVSVYRRCKVVLEPSRVLALLAEADVIVITSGEALVTLVDVTPPTAAARLCSRQLVVPSARVVKLAQKFRFPSPLQPPRMGDAAIVRTLAQWVARGEQMRENV